MKLWTAKHDKSIIVNKSVLSFSSDTLNVTTLYVWHSSCIINSTIKTSTVHNMLWRISKIQSRNNSTLHYKYCLWKYVNVQLYSVIGPLIKGYNLCNLHCPPDDAPAGPKIQDVNCTLHVFTTSTTCYVKCWSLL